MLMTLIVFEDYNCCVALITKLFLRTICIFLIYIVINLTKGVQFKGFVETALTFEIGEKNGRFRKANRGSL